MNGGRSTDVDTDSGGSFDGRGTRWRAVLVDVVIVAGWVGLVSFAWRWVPWPLWAYYVVVFGGILGYSLVFSPLVGSVGGRR